MNLAHSNVNMREHITLWSNEETYHLLDSRLVLNAKTLAEVKKKSKDCRFDTDLPDEVLRRLIMVVNRFKNGVSFSAVKPVSLVDPLVTLTQNEKALLQALIVDERVLKAYYSSVKQLGLKIAYEFTGFVLGYYFKGFVNEIRNRKKC